MFEQGGGGSYAAPTGSALPRPSNFAKMQAAMKRKEETGRVLERGEYTPQELAAVEARSGSEGVGWVAAGFVDVPLRIGWLAEKKRQPGAAKPVQKHRTVWTVQEAETAHPPHWSTASGGRSPTRAHLHLLRPCPAARRP
jgi:hypothetical protein